MNNNEKVASGGSHTDDQQSTTMQIPMKEISSLVRSIYTFLAVENDSPLTASQISQGKFLELFYKIFISLYLMVKTFIYWPPPHSLCICYSFACE